MLSKMRTLDQSEIPGWPRSAVVHHYSLQAVAELEEEVRAAIPSRPPFPVGVSIGLAEAGPRIQTLALATRDKVFYLSLQQPPSPAQSKTLRKLFSNIPYLTGFELPHTIVLLAHTLGSNVTGYDLTSLALRSKSRDITTPGDFFNLKAPSVAARRINELWDGDVLKIGTNSSGTPEPDYALRAWLTAMCVTSSYLHLLLIHL